VLRTCRSVARDHDLAMDAYTFVLGALRQDDHRRLRAYVPDGRSSFATWLIVVTRRLALDHVRRKYGRSRSTDAARRADVGTRRALEQLIGDAIDPDRIAAASPPPDVSLQRAELLGALRAAIASLAPSDRLLLALRFADERPVRQIAKLLAMPTVFHVYRRLGVLLARLRDELMRRGVESPDA
jgi:RNA polymerase sigma factor (sigma-70 family)